MSTEYKAGQEVAIENARPLGGFSWNIYKIEKVTPSGPTSFN